LSPKGRWTGNRGKGGVRLFSLFKVGGEGKGVLPPALQYLRLQERQGGEKKKRECWTPLIVLRAALLTFSSAEKNDEKGRKKKEERPFVFRRGGEREDLHPRHLKKIIRAFRRGRRKKEEKEASL